MLDDVEITDGKCPETNVCTFEDDVCYPWATEGEDENDRKEKDFVVQRADTFQALPADHTFQSGEGYYLLYKSTGRTSDSALLSLREPQRFKCASLWYYLSKSSNGCAITIGGVILPVSAKKWKHYRFEVPQDGLITVRSGSDPNAFAAIDDIVVDERKCSEMGKSCSLCLNHERGIFCRVA